MMNFDFVFAGTTPEDDPIFECGGCAENCPGYTGGCALNEDCVTSGLAAAMDAATPVSYVGISQAEDESRVTGQLLVVSGFDAGMNQEAHTEYVAKRLGFETQWDFPDCVCGCPFDSHGALESLRRLFGNQLDDDDALNDYIDFFVDGDTTFDLFTLASPPDTAACAAWKGGGPFTIDCGPIDPPVENKPLPNCTGS